jgi:HSP20 family molecular chaperone IbpA
MDYDYSKRSYLLPEGCKDLVDVIQPKTAITEFGFVVTARLPELQNTDIKITAEGNTLRIVTKQGGSRTVEVPSNYALAKAQAIYLHGRLSIVVPKAAA